MQRAVKSPGRPWRLTCALLGLLLIAASVSRSSYYFCAALQQTHASPCCKSATNSSQSGPAIAPICCEERSGGGHVLPGTPPSAVEAVSIAAPSVTELLPRSWQLPADSALEDPRWPIRAGPVHASELVIELRVLLS